MCAISASDDPYSHSEKRHSTRTASLPRMGLRAAIVATARSVWLCLLHRKDRSRVRNNTNRASRYLHPGDTFTLDAYPDSCAYTAGGPCLVLDVTLASRATIHPIKQKLEFHMWGLKVRGLFSWCGSVEKLSGTRGVIARLGGYASAQIELRVIVYARLPGLYLWS